ncbi:MAG: diguanylate cyclase [Pseudomonadota bacterium]
MRNWLWRVRLAIAKTIHPEVSDTGELLRLKQQLALSEHRLLAVTENLPVIITQFDREGRFTFVNRYITTVLPQDPKTLIGTHLRDLTGEELYNSISGHIAKAFQGQQVTFELCYPVDGVGRYFEASYLPELGSDGEVTSVFALWLDITQRKAAEIRQATDALRLRTIADNLPILIGYVDSDLRFEFCNATFHEWTGLLPAQLIGRSLLDVVNAAPSPTADVIKPHLARALQGERVEFELPPRVGGGERWLHHIYVPQIGTDGKVRGIYLLCTDVTQLKLVQRTLSEMARFDELTGLPNRYQLNEKLAEAALRNNRTAQPLGLIFLDIDHFKQVNDTLGHGMGDEVLREFARRLRASVRQTDTVARLAGDEFVIVLEALADSAAIGLVAEKILLAMCAPMMLESGELQVSSSIGGAYAVGPGILPKHLLECADHALYDAKRAGRATYRLRDYCVVGAMPAEPSGRLDSSDSDSEDRQPRGFKP